MQGHTTPLASSLSLRSEASRGHGGWRSTLVVAQVSVSVVLLVLSGLLVRTIRNVTSTDNGMTTNGAFVAPFIDLSVLRADERRSQRFFSTLIEELESHGHVESVTLTDTVPLGLTGRTVEPVELPGTAPGSEQPRVRVVVVGAGFLDTLGIPLLAGRAIDERDAAGAPSVAMVNRAAAAMLWNGAEDAVSRRLRLRETDVEIIGVTGNVAFGSFRTRNDPVVYLSFAQSPSPRMHLVVRSSSGPDLAILVRDIVRRLEPDLPVPSIESLEDHLGIATLAQRVASGVSSTLALAALLLASAGVYGIASISVVQRRQEIGVRMALGATRQGIVRHVVSSELRRVIAGLGIGLTSGAALAWLARGFLFEVSPFDPITFISVAALLATTGLAAVASPAVRSSRTNPVDALRNG